MNQYRSGWELKILARQKLRGKYGSSMLVTPVLPFALSFGALFPLYMIILIPYVVYLVLNNMEVSVETFIPVGIVLLVITLLCEILAGVLNAGIALFFLNIACGKKHSVADLFFGFRWQFKKSLVYAAITTILSNICLLPYQIFAVLIQFDDQTKWTYAALLSYLIGMAIYTPIQLILSQYLFLLLDFPKHSVKDLLKYSAKVIKGHKLRLLFLQLSFFPLQILNAMIYNLGSLLLNPYMNMTYALFFLDLMEPKEAPKPQFDQYV